MTPQQTAIKNALEAGETLTPLDALYRFGCMKLSTRIGELIRMGLKVEKKMLSSEDGEKHFMSYKIKKEQ